jgi:hypothetical protein
LVVLRVLLGAWERMAPKRQIAEVAETPTDAATLPTDTPHQVAVQEATWNAKNHNNVVSFFKRQANGFYKKTSAESRVKAQEVSQSYDDMNNLDKAEFGRLFLANKHTKTFHWAKDFTDTLDQKKQTREKVTEKYMTRTYCTIRGDGLGTSVDGGDPPYRVRFAPLCEHGGCVCPHPETLQGGPCIHLTGWRSSRCTA